MKEFSLEKLLAQHCLVGSLKTNMQRTTCSMIFNCQYCERQIIGGTINRLVKTFILNLRNSRILAGDNLSLSGQFRTS
jgi:hypothetical protein